jgi:hypothetical protein
MFESSHGVRQMAAITFGFCTESVVSPIGPSRALAYSASHGCGAMFRVGSERWHSSRPHSGSWRRTAEAPTSSTSTATTSRRSPQASCV